MPSGRVASASMTLPRQRHRDVRGVGQRHVARQQRADHRLAAAREHRRCGSVGHFDLTLPARDHRSRRPRIRRRCRAARRGGACRTRRRVRASFPDRANGSSRPGTCRPRSAARARTRAPGDGSSRRRRSMRRARRPRARRPADSCASQLPAKYAAASAVRAARVSRSTHHGVVRRAPSRKVCAASAWTSDTRE